MDIVLVIGTQPLYARQLCRPRQHPHIVRKRRPSLVVGPRKALVRSGSHTQEAMFHVRQGGYFADMIELRLEEIHRPTLPVHCRLAGNLRTVSHFRLERKTNAIERSLCEFIETLHHVNQRQSPKIPSRTQIALLRTKQGSRTSHRHCNCNQCNSLHFYFS